ncbi:MAG: cytochrome c [Akkermansiaceae bacterium]
MQCSRWLVSLLGFTVLIGSIATAEPVIAGFTSKHPLTTAQQGQVLVEELRCAACHEGISGEMKTAPDLRHVGSRITGDYLKRYLSDPHSSHPGTTMPDVLSELSAAEKEAVSESISHYLMSLTRDAPITAKTGNAKEGEKLYHEIGCVACHAPHDESGSTLKHLNGKYHHGELAHFLADPLTTRPSGRMPNLKLSSKEASAIEAYLIGKAPVKQSVPKPDLVATGKANFAKYNCVACHNLDESKAQASPKLADLNLDHGCLTNTKANYQLSESQKSSIKEFLSKPVSFTKDDHVKMKLTSLNCISCHQRDDYGGVSQELDSYFHSTEEALGNEARIPPPLTKIGGKLKPSWMHKVLHDGMSVRPYMTTRMPQYGQEALKHLPEHFAKIDALPELKIEPPSREERPMINNGGHLLLGTEGLNCISCHNYNGKDSPGMKGYDLIWSYQRLQPAWFSDFMKNPAKHRPGIIMPNYRPDGKAIQTDILNGDTEEQLRALWFQFSLGRSARDPKGLRSKPSELIVKDKVRVYRGRSRVAGYRGIAVGYPQRLNYSFNAQNGSLTAIWKGKFITANWRSQGAGDFTPAERPITLPQDLAFLRKSDLKQTWPLAPVTTKEAPENPDPLYPKNHGFTFKGYIFDQYGNPTFKYQCGDLMIEDHSVVLNEKLLRRTFTISSHKEDTLIFRALTGAITDQGGGAYATENLTLKSTAARLSSNPEELLFELPLSQGQTTYTIDYELLR